MRTQLKNDSLKNIVDINTHSKMDDEFYVIYNAQGTPCGRAITLQEADAICDKNPLYQWDIKKNKKYHTLERTL